MIHGDIIRIVPGADAAVLFVHGICGTPNHFRDVIPLIQRVPEDRSVYALLLPGHGGGVKEFSCSSMERWRGRTRRVFAELAASHSTVVIVGHSMGCLFAVQLAVEQPHKVSQLFLLGVPMRPAIRLSRIGVMLKMALGRLNSAVPLEASLGKASGIEASWRLWQYLGWIPRMLELFGEISRTEPLLPRLSVPAVAFQSCKDEVVGNASARVLKKSGRITVLALPESGHFYYASEDDSVILREFQRRICDP